MAASNPILTIILNLKDNTKAAIDGIVAQFGTLKKAAESLQEAGSGESALPASLKASADAAKALNDQASELEKSLDGVTPSLQETANTSDDAHKSLNELSGQAVETSDGLYKIGVSADSTNKPLADLGDKAGHAKEGLSASAEATAKLQESLNTITETLSKVSEKLGELTENAKSLVQGFLALEGVKVLEEFANGAAKVEQLGLALKNVAGNAGISASSIEGTTKALEETGLAAGVARKGLITLIQSGVDVAHVTELAEAAKNASIISGQSVDATFERFTLGIERSSDRVIKSTGIIITAKTAYEDYAAELTRLNGGLAVNADNLTDVQKRQAIANATLAAATAIAGTYDDAINNVSRTLQDNASTQEDISNLLGKALLPAYLEIVTQVKIFLTQLKLSSEAFANNGAAAKILAELIHPIAVALRETASFIAQNIQLIGALVIAYISLKGASLGISLLKLAFTELLGPIKAVVSGFFDLTRAIVSGEAVTALVGGFATAKTALQGFVSAVGAFIVGNPLGLALIAIAGTLGLLYLGYKKATDGAKEHSAEAAKAAKADKDFANEANSNLRNQIALVPKIVDAQQALARAKESGNTTEIANAKETLDSLNENSKALKEQQEEYVKKGTAAQQAAAVAQDATTKEKAAQKELQTAYEAVGKELDALELNSALAAQGVDLGKSFSESFRQVGDLIDKANHQFLDLKDNVVVTAQQSTLALGRIVTAAKSFDQISAVLDSFQEKFKDTGNVIASALFETATFNAQKAVISELSTTLGGYIGRQKELSDATKQLDSINLAAATSIQDLKTAFLSVGAGLKVTNDGFIEVDASLSKIPATAATIAQANVQSSLLSSAAAKKSYEDQIKDNDDLAKQEISLASSRFGNTRDLAFKIQAITKDTATKNLAAAKTLYDSEKALETSYAQKVQEDTKRIADLQKTATDTQFSKEEALFNLRIKGLSDVQSLQELGFRESDLEQKANASLAAGNVDLATKAANAAISTATAYAGQAKNANDVVLAQGKINSSYGVLEKIQAKQLEDAKAAQKADLDRYNAAQQNVKDLTAAITKLTDASTVQLKLTVEEKVLNGTKKSIQDYLSVVEIANVFASKQAIQDLKANIEKGLTDIQVKFNATPSGSTSSPQPGHADGGYITGAGTSTSDSIAARLSNGEYVLRASSVQKIGVSALHDMNASGKIPSFAVGGLVGDSSVPANDGTATTLNLVLNGKRVGPVAGSRDTVNALVNALKEVERTTG